VVELSLQNWNSWEVPVVWGNAGLARVHLQDIHQSQIYVGVSGNLLR